MEANTKITAIRLSDDVQKDLLILKIRKDFNTLNDLLIDMIKVYKRGLKNEK